MASRRAASAAASAAARVAAGAPAASAAPAACVGTPPEARRQNPLVAATVVMTWRERRELHTEANVTDIPAAVAIGVVGAATLLAQHARRQRGDAPAVCGALLACRRRVHDEEKEGR